MLKKYEIKFDPWALALFLLIMLPTFIWLAVPAPRDILRGDSATGALDAVASFFQAWMAAALCLVKNRNGKRLGGPLAALCGICALLYYASWLVYYRGHTGAPVILGLTLPPCLAFLFYAIGRRNALAAVPACLFTLCHVVYAICNFLV